MWTDFLTEWWKAVALSGETADEAFRVRCNRGGDGDDADARRAICRVDVAPIDPAEFVRIRVETR